MKKIIKSQRFQVSIFGLLLLFILSGIFSISNPYKIAVKAETQKTNLFSNPLVLLEIPGEIQIEFQTGIYVGAESDFQVGEKIMILLRENLLRAGSFPSIAEKTYYIISNNTGDVIWSKEMYMGSGWFKDPGGRSERGVNWIPAKADNYTAGIIFIQPFYENLQNNTNAIPFRVHKPGSVIGKVTESDQETPINDALVEAMLGNTVQSNTTTDNEGIFNLQIIPSGMYAIKVSKPGYNTYISEYIKTDYKVVNINFSLTVLAVSSTNNTSSIPDDSILADPSLEPENPIPSTIQVSTQIKLEPKTSMVNQEVKVNMIIEASSVVSPDFFIGLKLKITDPIGHTSIHGPFSTDVNGTASTFYTPVLPGNYTFQLTDCGELFNNRETECVFSVSPIVVLSVNSQLETEESFGSTQNKSTTNSQLVESASIQSSSEEISSTSVSTAPIPTIDHSITPTQTLEIQHSFQLPTTLEILGIVILVIFALGLAVNLAKKRKKIFLKKVQIWMD